jgi:hypothetical protein
MARARGQSLHAFCSACCLFLDSICIALSRDLVNEFRAGHLTGLERYQSMASVFGSSGEVHSTHLHVLPARRDVVERTPDPDGVRLDAVLGDELGGVLVDLD